MSSSPPIPPSPTPGKDPPQPEPEAQPQPQPQTEAFLPVSPPSTISTTEPTHDASKSADAQAMPPPPLPRHPSSRTRPTLITTTNSSHLLSSQQATPEEVPQTQPQMPVQPPNFAPLFVLVDDKSAKGTSTSHPRRVHYLFSDDDASELLTASLLSSMASRPSHMNPDPKSGNSPSDSREMERSGTSRSSSSSATFKLKEKGRAKGRKEKEKERQVERKERVIIVDVDKSGTEVTSVNSVSGRWQVVGAGIEKAPTFEGGEGEGVEGGLMLRIEGLGVEALAEMDTSGGGGGGSARESGTGGIGEDEMRELLEGFDRKMGILRKIVGAREKLAEGS